MIPVFRKALKSKFVGDIRVIVWDQHKLLYVRIPKSGNSSVRKAIGDGEECRRSAARIMQLDDSWTAFSFVRNPWARLVSVYRQKVSDEATTKRLVNGVYQGFTEHGISIHRGMRFEEFCEVVCDIPDQQTDKHLQSQAHSLIRLGRPIVPYIGKMERMEADWQQLMDATGLSFQLPHLNRTSHNNEHYSRFYTNSALINLVGDRYADDIRYFDYNFKKMG